MADGSEIARLRQALALRSAENQRLRREVDDLTFALQEITQTDADTPFRAMGLTPQEARLAGALLHRPGQIRSRASLLAAVYFDRPSDSWPDSSKIVDEVLGRLRQKLAGKVEIQNIWGKGWTAVWKKGEADGAIPRD